jgi:hypothetical protein
MAYKWLTNAATDLDRLRLGVSHRLPKRDELHAPTAMTAHANRQHPRKSIVPKPLRRGCARASCTVVRRRSVSGTLT